MSPRAGRPGPILRAAFYERETTVVARELLGHYLCRRDGGGWTYGRIVETEAYRGEDDPACHAASGLTPRNRPMYGAPGRSYVYFTYGMHHLLNAVTEEEGFPGAVLIRALEPVRGLDRMARRRGGRLRPRDLTGGPAKLCRALGLDLSWNDRSLTRGDLVICRGDGAPRRIASGTRVGIRKGRDRPWRFWDPESDCVSRP